MNPYFGAKKESCGYDPGSFSHLIDIEDRHFWFQSRNKVIAALMKQIVVELPPGYWVLEAGCGTGNVLRMLEKVCSQGFVVGMDYFTEAVKYSRQRTNCFLIQGDIRSLPFKKRFHIIGILDVLEHLSNDVETLKNLYDLLLPGGILLITVPAHPSLWSYFDEAAHHRCRYTYDRLEKLLLDTGYEVDYLTPYMAILYPVLWLVRRMNRLLFQNEGEKVGLKSLVSRELSIHPILNKLMNFLLAQEARLIRRRMRLPFGTSLLALARKGRQCE